MSTITTYTHLSDFASNRVAVGDPGSEVVVINSSAQIVASLASSIALSVKSITTSSNATFTGKVLTGNGSSGSPSFAFGNVTNTGFYLASASPRTIGMSINNTQYGAFSSSTFTLTQSLTAANISGTNTGDVTIGTANGLSLAAQALSMAAASSSATGVVTTGTQSFAGTKTFVTPLTGSNVASASSSASGVVTTGTQSFAGTKTFVTPLAGTNVASASSSASGVVTTGTQSFAGTKTFKTALAGTNVASASTSASGVVTTGTQSIAGAKTFVTQLIAKGTATNDSASSGYIGERLSGSKSSNTNFPTSGQWGDATSALFVAGDYDVTFQVLANIGTATTCSFFDIGISTTTGNDTTGLTQGDNRLHFPGPASANDSAGVIANYQISIASSTTYYFKVFASYSGGTPGYRFRWSARRMR